MNRLLLLITALIFGLLVCAQSYQYNFTYDGSGNRNSRTVVLLDSEDKNIEEETSNEAYRNANGLTDQIAEQDLRLYPNPTEGIVVLELTGLAAAVHGTIHIYASNGTLVFHQNALTDFNQLDLSQLHAGNYIVKVQLADISKEYQLIKL